jgi:hypothetical protein
MYRVTLIYRVGVQGWRLQLPQNPVVVTLGAAVTGVALMTVPAPVLLGWLGGYSESGPPESEPVSVAGGWVYLAAISRAVAESGPGWGTNTASR